MPIVSGVKAQKKKIAFARSPVHDVSNEHGKRDSGCELVHIRLLFFAPSDKQALWHCGTEPQKTKSPKRHPSAAGHN
jgi:hypothetical protein